MNISVTHPDFSGDIPFYLPQPVLGVNCLSCISINYNSHEKTLNTVIDSDEFLDSAQDYCPNINLQRKESEVDIVTELTGLSNYDLYLDNNPEQNPKIHPNQLLCSVFFHGCYNL